MKKGLIRAGVLILIFLLVSGITFIFTNKEPTLGTREMGESVLPVLYMETSDILINPMYGHAREMEQQYMRDSLTPLSGDRTLTVAVDPVKSKIDHITYRISTADGRTVVEEGKINGLAEDQELLKAEFTLEKPILMNQEYTLCFCVELENGKPYYYYTRLIQRSGAEVEPYLSFTNDFYLKCMDENQSADLIGYLEPDETGANSTYTKLNIHSSFERISWGKMAPELVKKAVPVIKEFNDVTCSIVLDYMISDQDEENTDYYHVTDFYRMRNTQTKIALLDFERNTQEIFDGENAPLTSKGINLGIVDKDVQYLSNKNADIVAFVVQGELWSYNRSANKITKVFGFWDGIENTDSCYLNHDIKIVRVEESGNIDFVVYGYVSRDAQEGEMGIGVYHYGAEMNQISEELFIPINTTFEYLKNDMEQLSYVTKQDKLYVILEDDLYQIDIKEKSFDIVQRDIKKECYVVSKTQANIAWMNEMQENASTSITVMNLERGESYVIQAPEGQKIKALGFMNEDFVYGLANEQDIVTDKSGNTIFAMQTVRIEEFGGNVIKEHQEQGVWVSDTKLEEGLLELKRVEWGDGEYVPIESDHIMNNLQRKEETVSIRLITTERKATQIGLDFEKELYNKNILYMEASLLEQEQEQLLDIELTRRDNNVYYVYGKGILDSTWTRVSDAIKRADQIMGNVLNRQQQYVWERGNRDTTHLVNMDEIPSAIVQGILSETELLQALGEGYTVLNMTGCTLDSILYQVGHGNPVIAKAGDGISVVIVGYDRFNTILYDPVTGEQGYYSMDDSTALFERTGNVFLGYMEPMAEPSKGE